MMQTNLAHIAFLHTDLHTNTEFSLKNQMMETNLAFREELLAFWPAVWVRFISPTEILPRHAELQKPCYY